MMTSTHTYQPGGDREPVIRPIAEGRVISPGGYPGSDEREMARRLEMFDVETPERQLKDLILPDETMQEIKSLLTKIRYHHVLYEDFGLAEVDPYGGRTAINLYGPPGTGKSFTAEAIAHELGKGIIRANYAEIESKYVGETAKNIQAAFQKAREADAVLFFDEADSILGRRLTHVRQSTDHAVNVSRSVMLLELDHFSGVTIFATNLASNYDAAFVRRILGHIELPLPNAEARARLWRYLIPRRMPIELDERGWERLVRESDGLAGGDILNIVINAASRALEREGPTCKVALDDFLITMAANKRARKEIGMRAEA
jgi:SpoVK/Ycf46/Vps4 family AAA+-type ATPase